ncbi:MAG: hypothetical protein HY343_02205 [Lentisphaerae bacterium]|nr:hypothetical protein [Lentisphaerota bacterium]
MKKRKLVYLLFGICAMAIAISLAVTNSDESVESDELETGAADTTAVSTPVPVPATNEDVITLQTGEETVELPTGTQVKAGPVEGTAAGPLVTISLDNVPVQDVVNMFSKISGANIIAAGLFTNPVTASLKDVEWKAALKLVLSSVNLAAIDDPSGIIMVTTMDKYREKLQQIEDTKPLETLVFTPQYMNAVDIIEQVKLLKILSPRGTIITSQSRDQDKASLKSSSSGEIIQNPSITTAIIVNDIKEYVEKVGLMLHRLDQREPQVFIEARILDILSSSDKKVGFDWEMLDSFGFTAGLRDLSWNMSDSKSVNNSTVNNDNQFDNRTLSDVVTKRYDIYGQPYEDTTTEGEGDSMVIKKQPTRSTTDSISRGRNIDSTKTDSITDTFQQQRVGTAILSVSDVSLFLSALKRTTAADIISHPVIVVGNKVEAKIHVGDRYPTVTSKRTDNVQATTTSAYSEEVQWNDLGLTLWVIPEINVGARMVRLTLNPQMSTWVKDITTSSGSVLPVISTRQVTTRVNVPSGKTVAIGGLVENRKGKLEKRVPLLGDIPLIGLLFRHTEDISDKHDLVVLLSPTILDEANPQTGVETAFQQKINEIDRTFGKPQAVVTNQVKDAAAPTDENTNAVPPAASSTGAVPVAVSSAETGTAGL